MQQRLDNRKIIIIIIYNIGSSLMIFRTGKEATIL